MKFLLGATAALLLGAIFVSWQGMQQGVKNASPDEMAALKQQFAELQAEVRGGRPVAQPTAEPDAEDYRRQLAELQRKLAEAEAAHEGSSAGPDQTLNQVELDEQLRRDEEGLIAQKMLETNDDELRRARLISQALLVGRVTEYVEDPSFGGFITFDVLMPEQVQVGSILGIRRNKTGILYQFKVSDVSPEGAIANPTTAIGSVKPVPGDELIFPPLY